MISTSLRIFMFISVAVYFYLIVQFLKHKALTLKYTLLWMLAGVIMLVLIIYPKAINWIINIVDIKTPVNGLFSIVIFFLMIILMSITSIVSKQSDKIKRLVQECAILEKRLNDIEKQEK